MGKLTRLILSAIVLIAVVACAPGTQGMPGGISESHSDFDGTRQLSMEPAWLYSSSVKLALFKNTKMADDEIVLTAVVKGAHSFKSGKSLHFNVDGDFYSFESLDTLTDINTSEGFVGSGIYVSGSNWSSKDYLVSTKFINTILTAQKVVVKVELEKSFAEGLFSSDGFTTARPAFREFMERASSL